MPDYLIVHCGTGRVYTHDTEPTPDVLEAVHTDAVAKEAEERQARLEERRVEEERLAAERAEAEQAAQEETDRLVAASLVAQEERKARLHELAEAGDLHALVEELA